ncbi:hypothetical protein BDM02DRAFT_3109879 [Thelephora ganbajun]|uniref:Uncharacterized protein n=1 Tax=Thelephora ganbajun TaxID=370292 RepID=A0ACB6ZQM0_THEGA|nr:hypothetical protein BDM02DRAFT_3109879 [Thelephora ganbajun]
MILAHIQSNVTASSPSTTMTISPCFQISFLASSQARVEPMTPILCPPPTPNDRVNASMHCVHRHTATAHLHRLTSACYVDKK